ncbi:MAG: glycosyltransferase family 4 protein [Lachnospiraceae bacterium]|nr:glycosyltransferase family 4 protein [Lachnospiraceae bacterium]
MDRAIVNKTKDALRTVVPRALINRRNYHRDVLRIRRALEQPVEIYVPGELPAGVNLYGDFELGTGLSRSVNLLKRDMELAGVPFSVHQVEEFSGIEAVSEGGQKDYAVNVFHLQPSIVTRLFAQLPPDRRDGHYNIAHWAWETPEFPKEWVDACMLFDEIWVPSVFVAKAIRRVSKLPVRVYPHGVYDENAELPDGKGIRKLYGIGGDTLLCLALYDGLSGTERKNPAAAIRVFKKAFPEQPKDAVLMIKSKGMSTREAARLRAMTKGMRTILVEGKLSYEETAAILAGTDVLLSLHRAEGFGLPVAEVMGYGGVVISTDHSATREFVNQENGCPVPCRLVRTTRDYGIYRAGTVWAQPDEEAAAVMLRRLYEDPALRRKLGAAAEKTIKEKLSAASIGERIRRRIACVTKTR